MSHPNISTIFSGLKQKSVKISSYFQVYQSLFERYRTVENLVFVEIGVMNGGSLFMWREFFGPKARIIGIDYSPTAERMREHGFEIFIGSQGSPEFWEKFYAEVGPVDILLDDGGHTNKLQIVTVECGLDHIKDGGMLVVEDTITSYLKEWGNPSRYSFMNYAKRAADRIQSRSHYLPASTDKFARRVHCISFYESMVAFSVDDRLCGRSSIVTAGTEEIGALNYWNVDKRLVSHTRAKKAREFLRRMGVEGVVSSLYAIASRLISRIRFVKENQGLGKYF